MGSRGYGFEDYLLDIGFNLRPGYRRIVGLGNNPDIDQGSVPEHIWPGGGLYPWMTGATSLEAVSTSVDDAPGGTGASGIALGVLDTAYAETTLSITLNGTTAVPITGSWFRINSLLTNAKGSGAPAFRAFNVGDIIIRDAGGGTVRAIMQAGKGFMRTSVFTVPAGFTAQILSSYVGFNRGVGGGPVRYMTATTYIQASTGLARLPIDISCDGEPYRHDGSPGITLLEKTDFALEVLSVSSDNSDVTGAWLGIMKQNQMP